METAILENRKAEISKLSGTMNYDFAKIKNLLDETKGIEISTLKQQFKDFKETSLRKFSSKLNLLKKNFDEKLETKKQQMKDKIEEQKEEIKKSNGCEFEVNNYEIQTDNFTISEIRKIFEKLILKKNNLDLGDSYKDTTIKNSIFNETRLNSNHTNLNFEFGRSINDQCITEVENIVGLVKKFSDDEKLTKAYKEMEGQIYWKILYEKKDQAKSSIEDKKVSMIEIIKINLKELKTNFLELNQKETFILPNTNCFNSDGKDLKIKTVISETCQKAYTIDCVFTAFITTDQESYIAWTNPANTVDIYEMKTEIIKQKMTGHTAHIYIVRHFYDKRSNADYLLSTSYDKRAIVWKYNPEKKEFVQYLAIKTGHSGLYLYSGLILFESITSDKNLLQSSFVITSVPNEQLKVFNFNGTMIRQIGNKTDYTYFIGSHFYTKKNCHYIINANSQDVKIIDFKDGSTVKTFKDTQATWHMSAFIANLDDVDYLFESDGNGNIRQWDFEAETIFKKIQIQSCSIRGILLWNDRYLVGACSDKSFKFFDLKEQKLYHSQLAHDNVLCTVQKVQHPNYGESILTCAIDGKLKLWTTN